MLPADVEELPFYSRGPPAPNIQKTPHGRSELAFGVRSSKGCFR